MGNYRFKLSNIIPNSWFYKPSIKKPGATITKNQSFSYDASSPERKSYYFTRDLAIHHQDPTRLPDPPRKSANKRRPTTNKKPIHRKPVSGKINSGGRCCCRVTPELAWTRSYLDSTSSESGSAHEFVNCQCKTTSSPDDIFRKVELPPIITKKPEKPDECVSGKWVIEEGSKALSVKVVKQDDIARSPVRKAKPHSYSPRVGSRVRVQAINGGRRSTGNRRSLSESMAVVKTSVDPQRDFKESMVEMIMENNMKSSKELEDLLACYLSLNSDEYHDLIIKVFKQIWFESTDIRL